MSKTKDNIENEKHNYVMGAEKFTRFYKYTNFGQVVDVFGKKAVVVSFEDTDAKCYYEEGGFDFINRDDLEDEMEKINNLII